MPQRPHAKPFKITEHGSIDNAVEALRQGARHYFEKPVDPIALAKQLATDLAARQASGALVEHLAPYLTVRDPSMIAAPSGLPRFAVSKEPVLIQGETGTGKAQVAQALHGLGP